VRPSLDVPQAAKPVGHLLLALVNVKTGSFGLSAGGVLYGGGSVAAPMLFFYKF